MIILKYLGGHTVDLKNLTEHHQELLSYMERTGYSELYINRFRNEINRIIRISEASKWNSYTDIYLEFTQTSNSKHYLRGKRSIIGAIEQFDLYGLYPDGSRRYSLLGRGAYSQLASEFQQLIDFYCKVEGQRGKKATTIRGESLNAASFLYAMQEKGCDSLDKITEELVLSFFLSEEGELIKSCSYKKNIAAVLKAGIAWNEVECRRMLCCLPLLRENRKNIQYLTHEEVKKVREALDNPDTNLSFRDRAVGLLLLYTGLRACDIASMVFSSIDWKKEKILVFQQKTEVLLELPLSPIVGNGIYDYLRKERRNNEINHIFLSETKPYGALASGSIANIVGKILHVADIRQSQDERRGTHIFRHYLASSLLENGIPQPVISKVLGHTAPNSLEPYLRADFTHLRECALSINCFPVSEGVFKI